jgi:Cu(I)/Ag(I) efflux system membrane fusion protein
MISSKVFILLAVGVLLIGGIIAGAKAGSGNSAGQASMCGACVQKEASSKEATYACPMHPDQTSTDPNAVCSICGMKMEAQDQGTEQAQVYSCPKHPDFVTTDPEAKCPDGMDLEARPLFACPMHPDEMTTDPDGKCQICGMSVEPVMGQIYACPMHPDEISTDPDAKCSICGMNMEPVKINENTDTGE